MPSRPHFTFICSTYYIRRVSRQQTPFEKRDIAGTIAHWLCFHVADAVDEKVISEQHDLFDDLDLETTGDAVENFDDEELASDNEDMVEDQLDMEEDEPKSLLDAPDVAKRFRDFYMAKLTQAFPNDLDQIRQEENFDHNKLEILIDSLEAGVDIFSDMEKNFAIISS